MCCSEDYSLGGILTLEDFALYESKLYEGDYLISATFENGYRICGPPPPSGSAVAQAILKILDEYGLCVKFLALFLIC